MKIKSIINVVSTFSKKNAPAILAGVAAVGLVITAISAYKAGIKASDVLLEHDVKIKKAENKEEEATIYKETAKKMAPIVAGPILVGAASVGCIFGSLSVSRRRIAALSAAYSISENALKDLDGQMKKILGDKKAREVKDAATKEKLRKDEPIKDSTVIITGNGDVLCKDMYSGRYFTSNGEKIGRAINWASNEVRVGMYVSLNEFYDQLDLPRIPLGDDLGWNADDLNGGSLPITYTAILTEDDRPCLCVESLAGVRQDYRSLY
ncbi:MAG: hypothetical protein K2G70_01075 [Turicibacter sp.]|nr:hypothetical protein [Turicibacter sp.]